MQRYTQFHSLKYKFLFGGLIAGLLFPLVSLLVRNDASSLYYVVCTAPIMLGLAGYWLGAKYYAAIQLQIENKFVQEGLGVGFWQFDPKTNKLTWDDAMFSLYELDRNEFSHDYQAWESALTPTTKQKTQDDVAAALRGEREFNTIFEIQTRSGRKQIGGFAKVLRDDNGEPKMMLGINWDRSREHETEKRAIEQQRLLEDVLANLPSMVFVKDYKKNLSFILFNRAGEKLIGVKASDMIGKTDYDFFPKSQADFFTAKDREVFEKRQVQVIPQEEINTPSGLRWLKTYKVPTYHDDGSPHLLIGISRDITDELDLKKQLELEHSRSVHNAKLASLGELSAGVAHEINNPLAIIVGNLPLLQKFKDNPEKVASKIEEMTKATQRISKIVTGLRKFSRSTDESIRKPFLINDVVRDALILAETKSKRHATAIDVELNSSIPILGDSLEVEQVIINLLNNAIDAVKSLATRWIKVRTFDEAGECVLQVIDSGTGISRDLEAKIFDPFFTTKRVGEGTGLGLSISKGILEQHGAEIRVNREIPNTCFEVRFHKSEANV